MAATGSGNVKDTEKPAQAPPEEASPSPDRVCRGCKTAKPLIEFHRDSTGLQGRRATCRDCIGKRRMARIEQKRSELAEQVQLHTLHNGIMAVNLQRFYAASCKPPWQKAYTKAAIVMLVYDNSLRTEIDASTIQRLLSLFYLDS